MPKDGEKPCDSLSHKAPCVYIVTTLACVAAIMGRLVLLVFSLLYFYNMYLVIVLLSSLSDQCGWELAVSQTSFLHRISRDSLAVLKQEDGWQSSWRLMGGLRITSRSSAILFKLCFYLYFVILCV